MKQALKDELEFASQTRPGYSKERDELEDRQGRKTVHGVLGWLATVRETGSIRETAGDVASRGS